MSKTRGFTHYEFDFDGGSCLRLLERQGLIQGFIFGEEELKSQLADGIDKLIFVDASPKDKESLAGIEVVIYDHHQKNDIPNQNQGAANKTSFDLLIEAIGATGLDDKKLNQWRQLVMLGDQKPEADDMDIARALKRVHEFFESNIQTYTQWFTPLFDSFFKSQPDLARAVRILDEGISKFLIDKPDSPAKRFLLRWQERIRDQAKIAQSTPRNLIHFLACLEENQAKEWVNILLEGYHAEQIDFQEGKADFSRGKVDFYGNTVVISAITKSKQFLRVVRNKIYSKDQDVDPIIREKITGRDSLWAAVLVNPQRKNFQIFINGDKASVHPVIQELVKAIRAEILLKRGKPVDFAQLDADGTIKDTEPLFFNRLETGFPSILWGSLKHPVVEAKEFGSNSSQIHNRLVEIIKLALDEHEFVADCNPAHCENCSIYSWQLKKCQARKATQAK
jgi:hypothetical protein